MIKVKRKVFVFVNGAIAPQDGVSLSVKLPHSGVDVLELPLAEPMGYGMGKHGWVTLLIMRDDQLPPFSNTPSAASVGLTFANVRLSIGLIQERHGSIGRSRLVGLHYRLGGPESAQCALGSRAAPGHRMPSSRPGDPTSEHCGLALSSAPHHSQAWGCVFRSWTGPGPRASRSPPACHRPCVRRFVCAPLVST